ncbi:MAG: DUF3810 domain-containing protein [Oscillospiraceae bacterium]|nr:DUF3810 domain-containing protein [Oscillospiraceae bacterium]
MKAAFRRHRVLCALFALDTAVLSLFYLLRGNKPLMTAFTEHITQPLKLALGRFFAPLPFSAAEWLYVFAILAALCFCVYTLDDALRTKHRLRRAARHGATLLCAVLTAYTAFSVLWGANYYADGFCDKSGVSPREISVEELTRVTAYFAKNAAAAAKDTARSEQNTFFADEDALFARAPSVYDGAEQLFPFLTLSDTVPKRMTFSRAFSTMGFTGFYCPFTGEANLNVDVPQALLPATIAHELSHLRGISSEQECNFLAVLACLSSGDAEYAYSGWLFGYIHLSNALYDADREAWSEIFAALDPAIRADLAANNAYWAQFRSPVTDASEAVYEGLLQSYGEERGMQSYGAVVDLLVVYFDAKTF